MRRHFANLIVLPVLPIVDVSLVEKFQTTIKVDQRKLF